MNPIIVAVMIFFCVLVAAAIVARYFRWFKR